jgi:osmotically inducible protein OsmC
MADIAKEIIRSATVQWEGDVAHGHGTIATESGKLQAEYSFGTRFSGDPGTNPEELLGASHAACFTMALSAELTRAGSPPKSIETKARVYLDRIEGGFEIGKIELNAMADVPGLSGDDFARLSRQAKDNCPLSKALRAVPIALHATLL